jgi:hypothetical protein
MLIPSTCPDLTTLFLDHFRAVRSPTSNVSTPFFPQLRTLSLSDTMDALGVLNILDPGAVPRLDNLNLAFWEKLSDNEDSSLVEAIERLAPQLVSFAWSEGEHFTVDKLSPAWHSFTSLCTLTFSLTFVHDLLAVLESLPTELHSLRILPRFHTSAVQLLTPVLVATRAWPASHYNLKMLTIPMVNPGSEERGELMQICDTKGVDVEEVSGMEGRDYVVYWGHLVSAWSVITAERLMAC